MIRAACLLPAFMYLLWSSAVLAQAVLVRTGEHDGFTRLVIDLPQRREFSISGERELEIAIVGQKASFKTDAVMQRLNAGRVLSISQSEAGVLQVKLACQCEIESYYAGASMLVLDIFGAPEADTAQLSARPASSASPEPPMPPSVKLPLLIPPAQKPEASSLPAQSGLIEIDTPRGVDSVLRRAAAREALLKQVGRGAVQGLLTPQVPLLQPAPPVSEAAAEATVEPARQEPVLPPQPALTQLNIVAITSADRDFLESRRPSRDNGNGLRCMDDVKLTVHLWGSEDGFAADISRLRGQLYGEFDKPRPDVAIELARAYIAYGFGVEARQVLKSIPFSSTNAHLPIMADLVEDGKTRQALPVEWHVDCDNASALWAYLGGHSSTPDRPLNEQALEAAFSALPAALRFHLGPNLVKRLQEGGKTQSAAALLRFTKRGLAEEVPAVAMAEAGLKQANGKGGSAQKELREVIEANGADAVQALVTLADLTLDGGGALEPRDIELAEAFAAEYRNDDIKAEIARALSKAYAAENRFSEALDVFLEIKPLLELQKVEATSNFLFDKIAHKTDDLAFLELAYDRRLEGFKVDGTLEHAIAKRLIALGFPSQALVFLSSAARGDIGRERKLLRAQAAISLKRPRQAEAELLGLHGEDVEALRVAAKIAQNDHRAARITLQTQGAQSAAAEQAWLAENLEVLAELEAEDWAAEQALSSASAAVLNDDKPLAQGRELLGESEELRALVSDVLSRHEVTTTSPAGEADVQPGSR